MQQKRNGKFCKGLKAELEKLCVVFAAKKVKVQILLNNSVIKEKYP